MKKIFFIAIVAVVAVFFTSCTKTTADGMIDWSAGFQGSFSEMNQAFAINKVYRSVFAKYGTINGEEESTGSSCYIKGATSKKQVNDAYTKGVEEANDKLRSEYSYTISTTKPSGDKVFTLVVKAQWSDWSDSQTFYLTK